MDYIIGIVSIIIFFIIAPIALWYSLKKNAGNFFELRKTDIEIRQRRQRERGLKILKKRLEKREITQEEYDELKKQFE